MEEGELAATSNCAIKDHAAGSIREPDQNFSVNSWSWVEEDIKARGISSAVPVKH